MFTGETTAIEQQAAAQLRRRATLWQTRACIFSLRDKKPVISGNAARKLAYYEEFCEVKLLRVQGVFDLARQGLACAPLLQPSLDEPFRNFSSVMTVQPADRPEFEISASFELTHFNIPNMTAPIEQRWQIRTCLGKIPKDGVPKGSLIF